MTVCVQRVCQWGERETEREREKDILPQLFVSGACVSLGWKDQSGGTEVLCPPWHTFLTAPRLTSHHTHTHTHTHTRAHTHTRIYPCTHESTQTPMHRQGQNIFKHTYDVRVHDVRPHIVQHIKTSNAIRMWTRVSAQWTHVGTWKHKRTRVAAQHTHTYTHSCSSIWFSFTSTHLQIHWPFRSQHSLCWFVRLQTHDPFATWITITGIADPVFVPHSCWAVKFCIFFNDITV